jgi:hypothetical protein
MKNIHSKTRTPPRTDAPIRNQEDEDERYDQMKLEMG